MNLGWREGEEAEGIKALSSIRKQGTAVIKGHQELHLLHMLRRNLYVMISASKSTRS